MLLTFRFPFTRRLVSGCVLFHASVSDNVFADRFRGGGILGSGILAGGIVAAGLWGVDLAPACAQSQERALTVIADSQSANTNTGVIVAEGNVTIRYPAEQVVGISNKATYFTQEPRIVMEGDVDVTQGGNRLQGETVTYFLEENTIEALPTAGGQVESVYIFPSNGNVEEGNAEESEVPNSDNSSSDPDVEVTDDPS